MNQKTLDLFALTSIPFVITLGSSMFIPVLPTIEKELNITSFQSSLIITVYSIIAIILIPCAGYLSDKIGRKKVIIPCLALTALGGALSAFSAWKLPDPYYLILVGRFLQGVGASGAFPVVLPTVGDMFKEEASVSRGLGLVESSNSFGKVLSPIVGSFFATVVWFFPFVAIPFLSLASLALVAWFVRVPKQDPPKKIKFTQFVQRIKQTFSTNSRWLTAIFFIGCTNMLVLFGFQFHLSYLLETNYDVFGVKKGIVLAIPLLMLCIAAFITGRKIGKNKNVMKWIIFAGNGSVFVALLFIQPKMSLLLMLSLLMVAGVGIGVSLPCLDALITVGIKKAERGTITSFYSSMRYIGVTIGPPSIAIIMKYSVPLIYIVLAMVSALAALFTFFAIKPDEKHHVSGLAQKLEVETLEKTPSIFAHKKLK